MMTDLCSYGCVSGLLPLSTPVFSYLRELLAPTDGNDKDPSSSHEPLFRSAGPSKGVPGSGFSDFVLSSHLHTPRLRLVCGSPGLSVRLRFAHIPEITDGWEDRVWFLAATRTGTTAAELVEGVCEELGIRRVVVQGSKSARVEYAIAELPLPGDPMAPMPPPPPLPGSLALPSRLSKVTKEGMEPPTMLFTVSASWLSHLGTVAQGFSKHARRAAPAASGAPNADPTTPSKGSRPVGMFGLWGSASVSKASAPGLSDAIAAAGAEEKSTGDAELDALSTDEGIAAHDDVDADQEPGTLKGTPGKTRGHGPQPSDDGSHTLTGQEADSAAVAAASTGGAQQAGVGKRHKHTPSTTARLSRMFDGWIGGSDATSAETPSSPTPAQQVSAPVTPSPNTARTRETSGTMGRSGRILSVSGPLELEVGRPGDRDASTLSAAASPLAETKADAESGTDDLTARFEALMLDLGIKGPQRNAMLALPGDRKRFLIAQNDAAKGLPSTPSRPPSGVASMGRMPGAPLSPQPTGDSGGGFSDTFSRASALAGLKRFSIASIASWGTAETGSSATSAEDANGVSPRTSYTVGTDSRPMTFIEGDAKVVPQKTGSTSIDSYTPMKPNHTGGSAGAAASLWSSWWGGGASGPAGAERDTPAYYTQTIIGG